MGVLAVENLTFYYPNTTTPAVRDVSFSLEKGSFTVICGATGSGKSTLLRLLKRELAPKGHQTGRILLNGQSLDSLSPRASACTVGYVAQRPEEQIVTDKVWHELAFGLENMGLPREAIARRIAEIASFFGIEEWYDRPTSELSGGQKQLLNLAAITAMDPSVLLLDEPTAQLDPIAASDFLAALKRLHRELAITVVMIEHRLEDVVDDCDTLMVMEGGTLSLCGSPAVVAKEMGKRDDWLFMLPTAAQLYHRLGGQGICPLNVRQGRTFLETAVDSTVRSLPTRPESSKIDTALRLSEVYFRYSRESADVLKGVSLTVNTAQTTCILGSNGAGKSTLLSTIADLLTPYSGTVEVFGKKLKAYKNRTLYRECVTMLPQDVQTLFSKNTVAEELKECKDGERLLPFDLTPLYAQHPYDLSGGQQQLVALAKVLSTNPKLLLLDEPTKGLDAISKKRLAEVLATLKQNGITIVIVTHDIEWAAVVADHCALLFRGEIVSVGTPREFFSQNYFYTTTVSRMTRDIFENAVTVEDALALCREKRKKGGDALC